MGAIWGPQMAVKRIYVATLVTEAQFIVNNMNDRDVEKYAMT
jgi:hypothetical protein